MPKQLTFIVLFFLLLPSLQAETYFVSVGGNDSHSGTSVEKAWATIEKINATSFFPGDTILFEGGGTFEGGMYFWSAPGTPGTPSKVSGTAEKPIVFSSYGKGRATISSDTLAGFKVYNGAGFVVKNLIFQGAGWEKNRSFGVEFYMDMPDTLLEYVLIDSVEVLGYRQAGISFASWNQLTGGFKDISVTNSQVHENGDAGMVVYAQGEYAHKGIYIGKNKVFNNKGLPDKWWNHTGDGIVVGEGEDVLIEFCEVFQNGGMGGNNGSSGGPVGILAYNSKNVLIQYNESHHNKTDALWDGGGIDVEGCSKVIMQYNYTHYNDGFGLTIAQYKNAAPAEGIVLRYNISENDARKTNQGSINLWAHAESSGIQDVEIYNNTIYITPSSGGKPKALRIVTGGKARNFKVVNNNFQVIGQLEMIYSDQTTEYIFHGNNFWNSHKDEFEINWKGIKYYTLKSWQEATGQEMLNGKTTGFSVDPQLVNPGAGITVGDPKKLYTLTGYELQEDSPLKGAALDLEKEFGIDPGKQDFFGNSLKGRSDLAIGAHQPTDNSRLCLYGGLIPLAFGTKEGGTYAGEGVVEENYFDPQLVGEGNHPVKYTITNEAGENQLLHHTFQVVDSDTTAWIGENEDWFNSYNWSTCAPTASIDVTILAPAEGEPVPGIQAEEHAQVRNLNTAVPLKIEEEGTLEITGRYQGPAFNATPESTIIFNSPTAQDIPTGTYGRLHLLGDGQKQLVGPVSVQQELALEGIKLFLGDHPLMVKGGATVTASQESYVVTDGEGAFTHKEVGDSRVLFPVGTASSYSPATLQNTGESDDFSVRVSEVEGANSGSLQVPEEIMNKIWFVEEKTAGGSDVQLGLQWHEADEPKDFLRTNSFVSQHEEGEWIPLTESEGPATEGDVAGFYMKSIQNLESFSAFAVGSEGALTALPDELTEQGPGLRVYPNPFSGTLNLEIAAERAAAMELSLMNVQGRQVLLKSLSLKPGTNQFTLALPEGLPTGLYLLSTSLEGKKSQWKVMKE